MARPYRLTARFSLITRLKLILQCEWGLIRARPGPTVMAALALACVKFLSTPAHLEEDAVRGVAREGLQAGGQEGQEGDKRGG